MNHLKGRFLWDRLLLADDPVASTVLMEIEAAFADMLFLAL